ncbi:hypothetical protein Tco_0605793, partial [Tanacetum coccineum]
VYSWYPQLRFSGLLVVIPTSGIRAWSRVLGSLGSISKVLLIGFSLKKKTVRFWVSNDRQKKVVTVYCSWSVTLRTMVNSQKVKRLAKGKDEGFAGTAWIMLEELLQPQLWHMMSKVIREKGFQGIDLVLGHKGDYRRRLLNGAFLLLTSLPSSYDNLVETLLYGRDTMKLEDVVTTLNSRELQKMMEAKGDGGEGLLEAANSGVIYVSLRSISQAHEYTMMLVIIPWIRNCSACIVRRSGLDDGYDNADVMMAMSVEELLDWIMDSGSSYYITYMRDYLVDFKEYDGDNILLGDGRECHVRGTGKVQVQMRDGSSFVLDNVSLVYPRYVGGFFGWLASIKQGMLEPVKVKCIFPGYRKGILVNKLWRFDDITSKVVLYRNMVFNESREYKKTFIGSGVGTGSMQVLQGVEFEVEPHEDHTFEVEPHRNVDHVVGSQEVQTQDLIYYHPARDREQHSAWELFSYREDSNEAAFVVAAVEKIYAHESLTFNNTVACEVISKWKAGLKDDMDARSDVYVLSNGCKKCSDDSNGYYWEYTPGMFIHLFLYIDDMVFLADARLRSWLPRSRIHNEKLVQTLLKGHFILSLEGSLSGDCDVEKNGKWSCIYAVGSQEYQMVCTRLDIASADVGMLDKFDRGLQTDVQVFVDFDYAMVAYMTLTEAAKDAIWLKRLAIESGVELKIVAGIATGALSKAIPSPRF